MARFRATTAALDRLRELLQVTFGDVPPINSAKVKLVKSALGRRSGREEQEVHRGADL